MSNLLKSLLESEVFTPIKDKFDAQSIHDKLDSAAEEDEVETVTFGLESDDDSITKVYVNIKDADEFEKELSNLLGEMDDISEVINQLSTKFDIVSVKWPDEMDDDDDDEDDKDDKKGKESLNDKVNYDDVDDFFRDTEEDMKEHLSYGQKIKNNFLEDDNIEPEENDVDDSFTNFDDKIEVDDDDEDEDDLSVSIDPKAILAKAVTYHQELAVLIMLKMGLSVDDIDLLTKKDPSLIRHLGNTMRNMDSSQRRVIQKAFDIKPKSIGDEDEDEEV